MRAYAAFRNWWRTLTLSIAEKNSINPPFNPPKKTSWKDFIFLNEDELRAFRYHDYALIDIFLYRLSCRDLMIPSESMSRNGESLV